MSDETNRERRVSGESVVLDDDESAPAVSSSSRRVASQDDSSSDYDFYDNYVDGHVKKSTKVKETDEAQLYNIPPAAAQEESFLEPFEIDDDLILDDNPLSVMDMLQKKGQQYKNEALRKEAEEINRIKRMAVVKEAVLGDQPEMFYPNPQAAKATAIIEKVKAMRTNSSSSSPLERSSRKDEVEETPSVTLHIHDLVKGSFSMEPLDQDIPFTYIAMVLSDRWNCTANKVLLTVEGEPLTDHSKTPRDLNLSLDGMISVKAMLDATPVVAPVASSSHVSVNESSLPPEVENFSVPSVPQRLSFGSEDVQPPVTTTRVEPPSSNTVSLPPELDNFSVPSVPQFVDFGSDDVPSGFSL